MVKYFQGKEYIADKSRCTNLKPDDLLFNFIDSLLQFLNYMRYIISIA